jgi:L-histidine N-alpha-methyltransferase
VSLLKRHCGEVAGLAGPGRAVIEFGSGSSMKTPLLLDCVKPAAYVPIDISGEFLRQSARALGGAFPGLPIIPLEADFMVPFATPDAVSRYPKLGFFPGSTIGNMVPRTAADLLRAMRKTLGAGAMLLVGLDKPKDEDILVRAYDDSLGVTAAFNLNLLHRVNRELGGSIPVEAFRHLARWNEWESRIEMHLEAVCNVTFVAAGRRFAMAAGETIHTENSHKYDLREARLLLRAGAWTPLREWTDPENKFALILAEAQPSGVMP